MGFIHSFPFEQGAVEDGLVALSTGQHVGASLGAQVQASAAPARADDETAQVERALASGFGFLRFESNLEHEFQTAMAEQRLRLFERSAYGGALLFALLLFCDHLMVPDQFTRALWMRVGVFAPFCQVGSWLIRWVPSGRLREWMAAGGGALALVLCLLIVVPSHSIWAGSYLVTLAVVVAYMNTVQRIRFWPALTVTVLAWAGHAYALLTMSSQGYRITTTVTLFLLVTSIAALYCNYCLERDERTAFLLGRRQYALRQKLRVANEQLDRHARMDALTGLPNRRHFDEFLRQAWDEAVRRRTCMALLMIDVDHFKDYNDRYGHQAGDECLRAVAQALAGCLRRPSDLVARWGGEEFAVVLNNTEPTTAFQVAQRMHRTVSEHAAAVLRGPPESVVTVSVGLAWVVPGQSAHRAAGPEELLARADQVLYSAKGQGRNRVRAATEEGDPSP